MNKVKSDELREMTEKDARRLAVEICVKDAVIDALPGGFNPDWSMDWRSVDDGQVVVTEGPDWTDGIPDGNEWADARAKAAEYSAEVAASIEAAREAEQRCREEIEKGDINAAREAALEAAKEEKQWGGDDPTYLELKQALDLD